MSKPTLNKEERLNQIMKGIGPTVDDRTPPLVTPSGLLIHQPTQFTRMTGAMLRKLVDSGAVEMRGKDEPWDYDSDIFKGGNDEESLAVLEQNPRFFAQGYIDKEDATITIDTIWAAEKVEESDSTTVAFLVPELTKEEIFAFANRFHRAEEFQINDGFARAWFD